MLDEFPFDPVGSDDLLFFGRIHPDKGPRAAIDVARGAGRNIALYGIVQDEGYYREQVAPLIDGKTARFDGPVGGAERLAALGQRARCST